MPGEVVRTKNFVADAANFIVDLAHKAFAERREFRIALSGGNTPRPVYSEVARIGRDLPWGRTLITFGDERCVPPDDPRSNYALADKTLFTPLRIAPSQIYRMAGECRDPQAAAPEYEQQLRLVTKTAPSAKPSLDLVLLGLGEDGHTASLFPGAPVLRDHQRLIAATQSPKDLPNRLTMTLGVINRASVILFLVAGANKAGVVRAILDPKTETERRLPASLVEPEEGRLIWFLDRGAAAELPIHQQRTSA